ncbi:putative glycolipid-binding domain-containing protein [Massilia sp. YIM B04103]|uniref:putative glycolipid-binding domain-containing protein n=1 Tax=Massilia sp. YIM B04103 TaxID=2963106 RepID=UPI00210D81D3|nr:putative glycolipid-binding domain-containing protein [Massilia sp. YIM B04103]
MNKVCRWVPEQGVGLEHLELRETEQGLLAAGMVIGSRYASSYGLFYEIELARDWTVRQVRLASPDGARLLLSADGAGRWFDADGQPLPALDGCIDVDISASCFTNTIPIRRLGEGLRQRQLIDVAFIRIPGMSVEKAEQAYAMAGAPDRYRYEGVSSHFEAMLKVDADGFVIDYPQLFKRIA